MKKISVLKQINKRIIAMSMLLVLMIQCMACGVAKRSNNLDGDREPYTFVDALGREVTVESCDRVASLIGSFSDMWLLAGGNLVAAVDDSWDVTELSISSEAVKIGTMLSVNTELLLASAPDFVIASANTDAQVQLKDLFEQSGITVAYFDVLNFDDYLKVLEIFTNITGREDLYKTNGLDIKEQIDELLKRVDGSKPTVLFLRAASSNVKAKGSEGTVGGEMLKSLGCINIADSDTSLLKDLSMEAIVKADPDYIFVTTQGDNTEAALANVDKLMKSSPVWSSLSAVKNNRYYVLDKKLYNTKPNARWGTAYKNLVDILYPEK